MHGTCKSVGLNGFKGEKWIILSILKMWQRVLYQLAQINSINKGILVGLDYYKCRFSECVW